MVLIGFRKKQVGHLKDLLHDNKLFNEQALRKFIEGKSQIQHKDATFKILRPADLELDDEQRSYVDKFEFRETIFDCECISLLNSSEIELIDCLVIGTLAVGDKINKKLKVYLDTVAVTGQLNITGRGEPMDSVNLVSVQAPLLSLYNFESNVSLMDSRFASTQMRDLRGNSLAITGCELGTLSIANYDFRSVRFPAGQVGLRDVNATRLRTFLSKWRFNPLIFIVGPNARERAYDSASRSEAKLREIETLKFLFERTEIPHSKRDAAELKYLRSLAESSGWGSRFFVFVTGGFIKPWRIAVWAGVVIFGFAWIYLHEASSFDDPQSISSYWDALYFSGLTFTTIGYGDIAPERCMRGFAILEGLLGVALGGAFLVSLTRRYIE